MFSRFYGFIAALFSALLSAFVLYLLGASLIVLIIVGVIGFFLMSVLISLFGMQQRFEDSNRKQNIRSYGGN